MKVLLDTHAFLWAIAGHKRLSKSARETFLDGNNRLFFSAASMWEICLKISLKKLSLKSGWYKKIQNEMSTNAIQWLPIEMAHCAELARLPFHHRDPFDRMLVIQAKYEDLKLLTPDVRLAAYGVECIW